MRIGARVQKPIRNIPHLYRTQQQYASKPDYIFPPRSFCGIPARVCWPSVCNMVKWQEKKSSDGDEEMDLLNRVWFVLIEKMSITSDWWQFILQKHLRWF